MYFKKYIIGSTKMMVNKWNKICFSIAIVLISLWLILIANKYTNNMIGDQLNIDGTRGSFENLKSGFLPSLCQRFYKQEHQQSIPTCPPITQCPPPAPCIPTFSRGNQDWVRSFDHIKPTGRQIIDYFNWANRTSCGLVNDFGGKMMGPPMGLDGQKAICLDPEVAPPSGPNKSCLIYSIGINNDWSFDDLMEKYGCRVFAFDPSMKMEDHNRSAMIQFYKMGISDVDIDEKEGRKWKLRTLETIYKKLGHEGRIIDYLKMDIEGSEWKVLPQILKSEMMGKIRQLGVEFHLSSFKTLKEFQQKAVGLLRSIEKSGFIRFDSKFNPWYRGVMPALDNYNGSLGFEIAWYQLLPKE